MKKIILALGILACSVLLPTGCNNARKIECENMTIQADTHINNYYFTHDTRHLDSALIVLKQLGDKSNKYTWYITSREMQIYYELREWDRAVDALDRLYLGSTDYILKYKQIMRNRILAKSVEDDIDKRNGYYNAIIEIYESIIAQNDSEIRADLIMDNAYDIKNSHITDGLLTEMFYYKAAVNGKDAAVAEIDSLQQKTSGNSEYFNYLKDVVLNDRISIDLTSSQIKTEER